MSHEWIDRKQTLREGTTFASIVQGCRVIYKVPETITARYELTLYKQPLPRNRVGCFVNVVDDEGISCLDVIEPPELNVRDVSFKRAVQKTYDLSRLSLSKIIRLCPRP
jgi:hypothetical protein